ncbi:MAG TPA: metallopeptidase family protein [Planctomycetota bacterium]|nr:metallopeptidase family protein [Planctomycetota bacterium]
MTRREFERIVEEAVEALPAPFRAKIENVVIRVAESPNRRQSRSQDLGGREPSLYGLYEGVPRTERGLDESFREPDRITIFKRAIERDHRSRTAMVKCIQETVFHELGHYFGLDDRQLDQLGYG